MSIVQRLIMGYSGAGGGGGSAPDTTVPVLWLDASDSSYYTQTGGKYSSLRDKNGGLDFVQATDAKRPTVDSTTFSLNAVQLGTQLNLKAASKLNAGTSFTCFMAGSTKTGSGSYTQMALRNGSYTVQSGTDLFGLVGGASTLFGQVGVYEGNGNVADSFYQSTTTISSSTKFLLMASSDGVIRINKSAVTVSGAITGSLIVDQIGENSAGELYLGRGAVGEIIVYDQILGSTERGAVEDYLKAKWGTP